MRLPRLSSGEDLEVVAYGLCPAEASPRAYMRKHTCTRMHTHAHLATWPALRGLHHPLTHSTEPRRRGVTFSSLPETRSPSLGAARRQRKTSLNTLTPNCRGDTIVPGV